MLLPSIISADVIDIAISLILRKPSSAARLRSGFPSTNRSHVTVTTAATQQQLGAQFELGCFEKQRYLRAAAQNLSMLVDNVPEANTQGQSPDTQQLPEASKKKHSPVKLEPGCLCRVQPAACTCECKPATRIATAHFDTSHQQAVFGAAASCYSRASSSTRSAFCSPVGNRGSWAEARTQNARTALASKRGGNWLAATSYPRSASSNSLQ